MSPETLIKHSVIPTALSESPSLFTAVVMTTRGEVLRLSLAFPPSSLPAGTMTFAPPPRADCASAAVLVAATAEDRGRGRVRR